MNVKSEHWVEKRNLLNEVMWRDRMTLQALRFLSIYLSRINARDINSRKVRFTIKEFMTVMEHVGHFNKSHFKSTINRLMGKIIFHEFEDGSIDAFPLFKKASLKPNENGEWYIEIDASDDALPLMFDFKKNYFKYELWNVLHLKSANALRMYEILKQYEKKGERTLTLENLRLLLGVEPTEYAGLQGWKSFKIRVLNACQKALLDKTDIKFTYIPIRNGRGGKVTGITFFIEKNTSYDGQMTFDDFLGYEDNQLSFDDFGADGEIIEAITIEAKPAGKRKKPVEKAYTTEESETLSEYAEVCKNQFTSRQIMELYELLNAEIIERGRIKAGYKKAYLQDAYSTLLDMEEKENIKNRFAYLKGVLKNLLKEKTLERKRYE